MLEECKTARERWGGVHQLIDRWLDERRELLVSFIELKEACDTELEAVGKPQIDRFSELLMDYISAGHFEIYPQLREEANAFEDHEALEIAAKLLERLELSTELVLAFDADFSTPVRCQHFLPRLPAWLDRLAKGLTERFALEDQLIARLHAAHTPRAETETE
ncbi:sigma D regulator [Billgrantia desiderata]|uniref:Sigma D regulator n=1 Tax=Billgrantia desiderata TaxID=52021 RepID=A0ABS9B186_9GAMM|nr:sigma D regulator [Halomonas desiderata]MCE8010517.1 sigma D regulator [Halomonas desiderata]MCE8030626.1 sigma D regulator [Halomonas desiderata]MCE8041396.1 sigma D regulator [Halomonas desiderata]MCE8045971.1 sigma D regulator [Halomonas desiderata]NIC35132.1 sigma D regulator [Halomonas desiderata]